MSRASLDSERGGAASLAKVVVEGWAKAEALARADAEAKAAAEAKAKEMAASLALALAKTDAAPAAEMGGWAKASAAYAEVIRRRHKN